ncbi:MAG TPA: HEAT repeat domain-containing protein [Gemmata sp.]|nr:HEAT repeat domain-containing protein [Gemmata sp.]
MTTDDPLPDLIRGLRSESPADRLKAAKQLGRLGWLAREALPTLVAALDDEDAKVRESAGHAVGLMGPEALPALVRMLTHFDKYVRRKAVWALGRLGPLAIPALGHLCEALKDLDPRTGSGAAQALGNMGIDGAEAVPALAEAMRGTNIVLCRLAAKALSQIGSPAIATLVAHLQHSDPFVRGESALAIGWVGPPARSAVPYLAAILRGPRSWSARTPPPGPSPLTDYSPGDPGFVSSDSPTPTENPMADSGTPEESCRIYAAQALGRIGPAAASALPDLREAARTGPEPLRRAAEQSVRQIEGE